MASKSEGLIVLWLEYFDANNKRANGRRVPKDLAIRNPKIEDLKNAAKSLALNPIIEIDKAYPKKWWRKNGRILVKKKYSKTKMIKQIAKRMKNYEEKK